MSSLHSSATPFNLPLFNAMLASSVRKEEAEKNGQRKWRMIGGRAGKYDNGGISEEENGADGDDEEEEEEEGPEKEEEAWQITGRDQQQQQREDGAVQTKCQQQQQQHMDIPAIAFQLLQQAMLRNESTQQQRDNEKFAVFGTSVPASTPSALSDAPRFSPQRQSNGAKFKKSNGTFASSAANGRRAAHKGSISAAATAALMAPSPLGALPAIPGALAVAASPAAQLFRDDDWSWHRNPAAAIRSGGTNKQTPVWKYFVYNKAENLSRCIVGTCTYQLKGPHTSTLACHLKKHAAEYAEFQRLKTEYTRERMVNGQMSSGSSSGGERPASARSTPFAAYPSSVVGILPHGNAIDECPSQKSRSPSVLSDPFSPQCAKASATSSPVLPLISGRFANCSVLEEESVGRNLLVRGVPVNHPPSGDNGIFGSQSQHLRPLGAHPPPHHFVSSPFQHFLIAAAAMAGQNNGMQQRFISLPAQVDCSMMAQMGKVPKFETTPTRDGIGQQNQIQREQEAFGNRQEEAIDGRQEEAIDGRQETISDHQPKKDGIAGGTFGSGGTGANLMDILNLLSKRAEAAASKENEQKKMGEETRGARETEDGKRKRKSTVERESDEQEEQRQWTEDGQRREKLEGRKGDEVTDEGQIQPLLSHSVEFILKDEDEREGEEVMKKKTKMEVEEKEVKVMEVEEKEVMEVEEHMMDSLKEMGREVEDEDVCGKEETNPDSRLSPMDRLALFLGTAFPPTVLRHLMKANTFLSQLYASLGSDSALTFENVDKLLDSHFGRMKGQIRRTLARVPSPTLLVDICCWRCWKNGEELKHLTDGCQCQKGTEADLLCSFSLHQQKRAGNAPILLAMRRIRGEKLNVEEEKQNEKGEEADEVGKAMCNCVEQILSDYFSDLPSSRRPSLILVRHPPFLLHFSTSICSIPCLPATLPHRLQKRLLIVLSEKLQMSQLGGHLDRPISADDTLLLPSSSRDNNSPSASAESLIRRAKEILQHQQTSDECHATELEKETLRELVRLHAIITETPLWAGPEEVEVALSAIRKDRFGGTIDGLAQRIVAELSNAADALKVQQQRGGIMTGECLIKNTFMGRPSALFGGVTEEGDTQWTERSAMLLFNGESNGHK